MKNKLSRIVGVAVSLALVASLCVFAIPAATPAEAAAGKQQWSNQTLPTNTGQVLLNGSNVTDYAVASDGLTIYASNNGVAANAPGAVLVSTDGGQSWTALTVANAAAGSLMGAIAVAPDDASYMAVVELDAGVPPVTCVVWISTNGGKTWTTMPAAYQNVAGAATIMDIDVGPARSGCVFGREYVVAFADPTNGSIANGDVQIIGRLATWATIGSGVGGPYTYQLYDYMSVEFSPNFVGDRTIACVGASNRAAGDVVLQLINDGSNTQVRAPVVIGLTATDYDSTSGNTTGIIAADIALPSDFDPTVSSLQRSYACFAAVTAAPDTEVYRIDAGTIRNLDAVTLLNIKSVAYTGTVDEGTLFIGEYLDENVKYASDPTVSIPSWKSTKKAPSADPLATNLTNAEVIVRVSPTDANVIFAGTSGPESAFSVSNNAAVSFDGESLIDNGVANDVRAVQDIYLTPDGGTIFMATDDGTQINLWKSAIPTGSTSWSRVRVATGTTGMVRLNPGWDTTPSVYFADLAAAGGGNIYVSTNGGDTFSTRTSPTGILALDIVVESSSTLYLASGANVYKSTNGAWTWATPVSSKVTAPITTLAMAPSYPALPVEGNLLVGGTSSSGYSTDGATTFTRIAGGLAGAGACQIGAHEDYADNNTIYAGGAATTNVYRFVIGTSSSWEDAIATCASAPSGMGMANGVLYVSQAGGDDGAMRTLSPTAAAGSMGWEEASEPLATAAANRTFNIAPSALRVAAGSSELYAIDTLGAGAPDRVYAYSDLLATDVTTLTAPADGATINVDPVSGRAEDIQFAWSAVGSGTGLVDGYQLQICVAGSGFAAPLSTLYYDAGVPAGGINGLNATNPQLSVGAATQWVQILMSNTDYEWRVRARDQVSTDAIRSNWSEVGSFSIQAGGRVEQAHAGPIMLGPTGGATDVTLTPGFSWAPVPRTTEYEFILASDAGLTSAIAGTPVTLTDPAYQVTTPLEYGTVYFWAVKSTSPTVSPQSIGSFTTMAEPAAAVYTCMQCGLLFDSEAALEAHIAEAHAPVTPATPAYIWGIIAIGAVLVIVVIVLIVRTRRVV
ncbi:MAG: hypothetical protein KAT75_00290 [Dehalococcoidia bacterium]|nr:hypothetical protein [Dehalococcoidia bacterium]